MTIHRLLPVNFKNLIENHGVEGDHYANPEWARQITLIQGEHLEAVASLSWKRN